MDLSAISGFRRVADKNSALLGYYHYSLHNNPQGQKLDLYGQNKRQEL
jgi:hypothetical protein